VAFVDVRTDKVYIQHSEIRSLVNGQALRDALCQLNLVDYYTTVRKIALKGIQ